jgi:hypothetical protein
MGGYRDGVAERLRTWFEDNVELREELERRVARAWETSFIAPLKPAAGIGPDRTPEAVSSQDSQAEVEE